MNKQKMQPRLNHILSYGHNWGFVHVREEITWRASYIKSKKKEIEEMIVELKVYKDLIKSMEKDRRDKK